ncbi:MAG: hypothetical protein CMM46_04225 [Rhodospirillaceae bacterium]|nr:hypothetical protein [Rhodospirillaceae bacterium]|tara:strand:- start:1151 stop:1840 length:690 start_codon:yes stop_codon:yes gene_type:complete
MSVTLKDKAATFRALHEARETFVMPNAWNAGSARLLEGLGFKVLATTSAGINYANGLPDGPDAAPYDLTKALDAARGEATREERQKVDIASLVRSLVDDLADAGEEVSYAGPDRLATSCRPVVLRRAIANLIQNTLRYAGSAEVSLAADDTEITLEVADRGPGIPEDRREATFRPFMRGDPSRNRETDGTGLGLAITRSNLRAHGGDVAFDDREGGGLIVRAAWPRQGD